MDSKDNSPEKLKKEINLSKTIIKKWESQYQEVHDRKPDKQAMHEAPVEIKTSYKRFWKLTKKLKSLENANSATKDDEKKLDDSGKCLYELTNTVVENNSTAKTDKSLAKKEEINATNVWGKHLNKSNIKSKCQTSCTISPYSDMACKMKNFGNVKTRLSLTRFQSKSNNDLVPTRSVDNIDLSQSSHNHSISTGILSDINPQENLSKSSFKFSLDQEKLQCKFNGNVLCAQNVNLDVNTKSNSISDLINKPIKNTSFVIRNKSNLSNNVQPVNVLNANTKLNEHVVLNRFNSDWVERCNKNSSYKTDDWVENCDKNSSYKSDDWVEKCDKNDGYKSDEDIFKDDKFDCNKYFTVEDGIIHNKVMLDEELISHSGKRKISDQFPTKSKILKTDTNTLTEDQGMHFSEIEQLDSAQILHATPTKRNLSILDKKFPKLNSEKLTSLNLKLSKLDTVNNKNKIKKNESVCDDVDSNDSKKNYDSDLRDNNISESPLKNHNEKVDMLEKKIKSGKCNENYRKINLKKKIFLRGKKRMTASKYKRKEWEKKQFITNDEAVKKAPKKKFTCFKCGDFGHWAKDCMGKLGDKLMAIENYDEEESSFLSLKEARDLAYGIKSTESETDSTKLTSDNFSTNALVETNESKFITSSFIENNCTTNNDKFIDYLYSDECATEKLNESGIKNSMAFTEAEVLKTLKMFGFESFRTGQKEIIMRILSGQSAVFIQSTGSGKSLCYQLPSYLYASRTKCITICVSPLVSLMEDQIYKLPNFLKAVCLHTQQSSSSREKAVKALESGCVHFLLISPESIVSSSSGGVMSSIIRNLPPIAFACLDEVHCLSEWSHNFRPSYLQVCKTLREKFNVKTFLGLTATATTEAICSIKKHLCLSSDDGLIIGTRIPDNLKLSASRDENRDEALIHLLNGDRFSSFNSIIIYCTRREECERVATFLRTHLIKVANIDVKNNKKKCRTISVDAEAYHAGLSGFRRQQIQKKFISGKLRIVVATVAFGMGIDKADVQGIIHYNMPRNVESYVQEIGRAGRNGEISHCHLFLNNAPGIDMQEIKRHIFANSVDRFSIRKLLNKIFASLARKKSEISESEKIGCKLFPKNLHCNSHEVALQLEKLVQSLDLPEENIQTLLCYLESQAICGLKLHRNVYATCRVFCYRGPNQLCIVSRKCPPLAAAIAILKEEGKFETKKSSVTFPVVQISSMMGWKSGIVKHELKKLEWDFSAIETGGKARQSGVKVEFDDLSFLIECRCDLSEENQDELLEQVTNRANQQEKTQLKKLQFAYETFRKNSHGKIIFCCDNVDEEKNESITQSIREYFRDTDSVLSKIGFIEQLYIAPDIESKLRADIRSMVSIHSDHSWTGRAVARVLHGISSPNFPANVWGRVRRFWRLYLNIDFNLLLSIANNEILKMK